MNHVDISLCLLAVVAASGCCRPGPEARMNAAFIPPGVHSLAEIDGAATYSG